MAHENPEPGEEPAEVVTDGGEDCVRGIAVSALEIAAAEIAIVLHVADDGFDGGLKPQLALDGDGNGTLLSGDEDAAWICSVVAAVALVDKGALDLTAC